MVLWSNSSCIRSEDEGLNLAAARSHGFSLVERRWKAVDGERRWKVETSFEASISCGVTI